ncbi:ABC transporter substrate-binding protein [Rhodoferax aquaticus]|uniref:Twin-arginine translocation pathway signal protein n=1 Tax=Rhodoferax aquaticus TaxID=2527691 RepID=A0A515ENW4_9BURK|nr:ABC transporter substrate-binding protein [Rhodoferax aquaticus]QDL54341.1 twin-arginine translocation pathway signal protein [Rhodoferax aquaticus]
MHHQYILNRRKLLGITSGLAASAALPAWAQASRSTSAGRISVAQIVDMSATQIDVSKDFLVGARAAWSDINAKGGLRGKTIQHQVIEVDGTAANLRAAVESLKNQTQCVALFGTSGDRAASQIADILRRELPDIAHIAPWLQNLDLIGGDNTFPIFASRQDQITHAVKSLAVMGVTEMGAVYGSPAEFASYKTDVELAAQTLGLRLKNYSPSADLQQLGKTLTPDTPRVLVFIGGTPELYEFSRGIDKQAALRYIVGMSDVNLQTLSQMGSSRHAQVVATQVVPLVNSNLPIVRAYRDTLGRLYDEPPTPHSLAGFMSARYTYEMLQSIDGAVTRQSTLQALQKRSSVELGGFRLNLDGKNRSGTYVTQSMIAPDGRLIG